MKALHIALGALFGLALGIALSARADSELYRAYLAAGLGPDRDYHVLQTDAHGAVVCSKDY